MYLRQAVNIRLPRTLPNTAGRTICYNPSPYSHSDSQHPILNNHELVYYDQVFKSRTCHSHLQYIPSLKPFTSRLSLDVKVILVKVLVVL